MTKSQSFRMVLGWSQEKLAYESSVETAAVYLLERMGTAGPKDDAKIYNTLARCQAERLQRSRLRHISARRDDDNKALSLLEKADHLI